MENKILERNYEMNIPDSFKNNLWSFKVGNLEIKSHTEICSILNIINTNITNKFIFTFNNYSIDDILEILYYLFFILYYKLIIHEDIILI